MMKKTFSLLALTLLTLTSFAQTAKEEIYADILKSGSNYMAYQAPNQSLTKAPKGYEPFYMSHYGRHGSRWLINENDYTSVMRVFRRANELGKLTPFGKEALEKLERFYPTTKGRLGELSDIGEQQHHGIGRRMTQNFPEIFSGKDAEVDARSTVVIRCILSMTAECEELTAFNPKMKMHNDVSESFQYYLNHNFSQRLRDASRDRSSIVSNYSKRYTHPERFCRALFNDESYWNDEDFRPRSFMRSVFNVVTNMQSHSFGEDMWNLFTTEECYDLWKIVNIDWYLGYGAAPQTGSIMQFNQADLLHNIIETTDTVMASKTFKNGATLRFGHEVCVMPLACLMELDSCGRQVQDLDHLEDYWVNYRIYPMACNIQLIFYRPKNAKLSPHTSHLSPLTSPSSSSPILVKALLNEKEATLPIPTDQYPYYKWDDLRTYYLQKLTNFEQGNR